MHNDKPIYCHQINHEIHKHLALPVNIDLHRTFLRTTALATTRPLYAGHAQVIECFYTSPALLSELAELSKLNVFVSLSKHSAFSDFVESRKQMYHWDRSSYPMYFESNLDSARSIITQSQGDPETTSILRETFSTLYQNRAPAFENLLSSEERKLIEAAARHIRKHIASEGGAVTSAFFRKSKALARNKPLDRVLSKILPAQFTSIYSDVFEAITATGFPQMSFYEDTRSFPFLDFDIVSSLLVRLGLHDLVVDHSEDGTRRFLSFRAHKNFYEFVRSKDNLLFLMQSDSKSLMLNRSNLITSCRRLNIEAVRSEDSIDPFFAAASLYRASEKYCNTDATAAAKKGIMPTAQSWRGRYLIMTATDLEDEVLGRIFQSRGFSSPKVVNAERFSFVERFRSDIGRVFHVRSSAGSGGASGSFITGKNAISELNPDFVISVGICFGLHKDKQSLGEIVVSELIHDYEKLRISDSRFEDRGATRESSPILLSRARANLAVWAGVKVHVGTVVSGEKLVDQLAFRDFLKTLSPPPIAGEMEASGLSAVCHELQKQFIMVKGICDWGFDKSSDHQEQAAQNACQFVFEALVAP